MKKEFFSNKHNKEIHFLSWSVNKPKGIVVIAHGMAEHPMRYQNLAHYLNQYDYSVYAIFHIGHGDVHNSSLGHFAKNGFTDCVDHINDLIIKLKNQTPNSKIFLLGHSMGSFMAQEYIAKYGENINGVILSGSSATTMLMRIGAPLADIVYRLSFNKHKPSKFLDKLSFGSYNKAFKPNRSKFDWLSRDQEEVDKYVNDQYCGFICTASFFRSFTKGLAKMQTKGKLKRINRDLPILLLGGSMDPVSHFGDGLQKLLTIYQTLKIKDVSLKLYKDARHEIYNEINKDEVYLDTLNWLDRH